MEFVKSAKNSFFKEIRGLKLRKYREESGLFIIEGLRFVEEGISAGINIRNLIMTEDFYEKVAAGYYDDEGRGVLVREYLKQYEGLNKEDGGPVIFDDNIFREISDTDNPQGVLAVVRMPDERDLDAVANRLKNWSFLLILEALQDPGNMGTVIRTGDAAGVDCIILTDGCVDVYNPKTLRATMGSIFHVPVVKGGSSLNVISTLRKEGYKIYASHLAGEENVFNADFSGKTAIIVGNEARGIDGETAQAADFLVKIPMPGKAESLNASVAAGILLYEVVRKKNI